MNRDLKDTFAQYQKKTLQSYSSSITHSVSALQEFLQILVYDSIGKGDIKNLIKLAVKNKLIPDDTFSNEIFGIIESTLMKERQLSGDPHPKQDYANEETVRFVLNLTMVFIQHCLQYKKS